MIRTDEEEIEGTRASENLECFFQSSPSSLVSSWYTDNHAVDLSFVFKLILKSISLFYTLILPLLLLLLSTQ